MERVVYTAGECVYICVCSKYTAVIRPQTRYNPITVVALESVFCYWRKCPNIHYYNLLGTAKSRKSRFLTQGVKHKVPDSKQSSISVQGTMLELSLVFREIIRQLNCNIFSHISENRSKNRPASVMTALTERVLPHLPVCVGTP